MAFRIKRSLISDEQALFIRKNLCLQPFVQENRYTKERPDPVLFYNIIDGELHLPYMFSASMFQINPNIDLKFSTSTINFKGTLREAQIPVEQEIWDQLTKYGTSTAGLYPGFGKTILGAKSISRAGLLSCVLVHREILTSQWKKTFESFTDASVWIVGEKNPPPTCNVIICMDTRWDKIPAAMRDAVGFLIIDEAHAFCTPTHVSCLLAFHPKYILAESATLERDDEMHSMIQAIVGTHGVFKECDKPFSVVKIVTNIKVERKKNRQGGVDWTALVHDTLMNERRNKLIVDLVLNNSTSSILILTSLVDHALLLHEKLQEKKVSSDYMCGNRKGYKDCSVLIGTTSKVGTGFDQGTFCENFNGKHFDLLILVCSLKKYSMLVQNVGRALRSDAPTVFHLVDDDDIYKSHWYLCRKWYMSRSAKLSDYVYPKEITADTKLTSQEKNEIWIKEKCAQLKK